MEFLLQVLFTMAVIFIMARAGSFLFSRFGLPGLIGEILIGILIANIAGGSFMHDILDISFDSSGYKSGTYTVIYTLAELGVIFLLFSVGLETKVKDLLGSGRSAMLCALLGVILPFIAGLALVLAVGGYDMNCAMFMGAAMVATSVGITARIIKDMKLMEVKESRIIIAAAVIDDVLGMIVLAIVQGMSSSGGDIQIMDLAIIIIKAVAFVLIAIGVAKYVVPKIYDFFDKRNQSIIAKGKVPYSTNKLILAIIVCLSMAALAEFIGLAAIIGAFLAGMMFADHAWEWDLEHKIEAITSLMITFFFVNVGLMVDISSLTDISILGLVAVVIVLAMVTKYIGCGLGARLGDKTIDKSSFSIIGVGMMPRGEVGIIIASIGLNAGVMTGDLYTVVVMMSVLTTIIAPPILSSLFKKKYKEEYEIVPEDTL
ncbi:MAG: cation:proton antiporter [Candidatus Methanomethylophilaceae archaeon]|nr:cation:proton antiporter [Candidatus Methanomethylophilaceae archaeon]MBP5684982.1 cation:proton antiporter [Candidatus Methanomethylophilaceae archaeon]